MSSGLGLKELKSSLMEIALTHPTVSVSKVKVPQKVVALHQIIQNLQRTKYYMEWIEFEEFCSSVSIHTNNVSH